MGFFDFFHKKQHNSHNESTNTQKEIIMRQYQILMESVELVNTSWNVETVLRRYIIVYETLKKLSTYTPYEMQSAGLKLQDSLSKTLSFIENHRISIINQAIQRNFDHKLNSLKTENGKLNALNTLYDSLCILDGLDEENKQFLQQLYEKQKQQLIHYKTVKTSDSQKHKQVTVTTFADNTYDVSASPDEFTNDFYTLSSIIDNEKDIYKKLEACEKCYLLLPEFCRSCIEEDDGELPPFINCRDIGPDLYMRLGEWDKAEKAIKLCIDANAYYPNNGTEELTYLASYHNVATEALSYISKNPGCLQRNIYKALPFEGEKKEQLKYFLRTSLLINKEKSGNTNKLYCKTTVNS